MQIDINSSLSDLNETRTNSLLNVYLHAVSAKTEANLTLEQIRNLISLLRSHLKEGFIDVTDVSSICHSIWNEISRDTNKENESIVLFLYEASELSYAQKQFISSPTTETITTYLNCLQRFFNLVIA